MILESIVDLIEQDLFVGHNHDTLVYLHAIVHDAILIFRFQQRNYVHDTHVLKPERSKPREGCLHPDYPFSCIEVETNEPPMCVADVLH